MIALDTNTLVRLLVGDDVRQRNRVEQLLLDARNDGEQCFLSDPVLCEVEWVLESCYDAQRQDVLAALQELAANPLFVFEDADKLRRALDSYERGSNDFSDYLIGIEGEMRKARTTYTFDRVLGRHPAFTRLR